MNPFHPVMFPVSMNFLVLVWSNIDYSSAYVLLKWIESHIHTYSLQHICLPHPYDLLQSLKFMHKTSVKGPAGMPGLFVNEQFFKTLTLHLASSCHLERVTTEVPGPSSYLWSYEPNTSIESKRFALKGVLGPHVLNQEKRVPRWRNHTCIDLPLNPSRDDYYSWHMQAITM